MFTRNIASVLVYAFLLCSGNCTFLTSFKHCIGLKTIHLDRILESFLATMPKHSMYFVNAVNPFFTNYSMSKSVISLHSMQGFHHNTSNITIHSINYTVKCQLNMLVGKAKYYALITDFESFLECLFPTKYICTKAWHIFSQGHKRSRSLTIARVQYFLDYTPFLNVKPFQTISPACSSNFHLIFNIFVC
jgi:hypothetical protein